MIQRLSYGTDYFKQSLEFLEIDTENEKAAIIPEEIGVLGPDDSIRINQGTVHFSLLVNIGSNGIDSIDPEIHKVEIQGEITKWNAEKEFDDYFDFEPDLTGFTFQVGDTEAGFNPSGITIDFEKKLITVDFN